PINSKKYYVYILASLSGTLYIGITDNLERRMVEHKEGLIPGFTKQYGVHRLVYFEVYSDVRNAIRREKQLKGWRREKKIALIRGTNPSWRDLARAWYEGRGPSTRAPKPGALAQDDR
ncbi:MAG: GIY-YIG nuclease family protein, partial [Terriglobales bacterium]